MGNNKYTVSLYVITSFIIYNQLLNLLPFQLSEVVVIVASAFIFNQIFAILAKNSLVLEYYQDAPQKDDIVVFKIFYYSPKTISKKVIQVTYAVTLVLSFISLWLANYDIVGSKIKFILPIIYLIISMFDFFINRSLTKKLQLA